MSDRPSRRDERREIAAAEARAIADDPVDLAEIRAIGDDIAALPGGSTGSTTGPRLDGP